MTVLTRPASKVIFHHKALGSGKDGGFPFRTREVAPPSLTRMRRHRIAQVLALLKCAAVPGTFGQPVTGRMDMALPLQKVCRKLRLRHASWA